MNLQQKNLWLVGPTSENILGAELSTNGAVLKHLFSQRVMRPRIVLLLNTLYKKFSSFRVRQKFQHKGKMLAKAS